MKYSHITPLLRRKFLLYSAACGQLHLKLNPLYCALPSLLPTLTVGGFLFFLGIIFVYFHASFISQSASPCFYVCFCFVLLPVPSPSSPPIPPPPSRFISALQSKIGLLDPYRFLPSWDILWCPDFWAGKEVSSCRYPEGAAGIKVPARRTLRKLSIGEADLFVWCWGRRAR